MRQAIASRTLCQAEPAAAPAYTDRTRRSRTAATCLIKRERERADVQVPGQSARQSLAEILQRLRFAANDPDGLEIEQLDVRDEAQQQRKAERETETQERHARTSFDAALARAIRVAGKSK